MKTLQKFALAIALTTFFASCQSNSDVKQILANSDARKAIMDSIANNSTMSTEMMEAMMNNKNSAMMMHGNEKMTTMMMGNHEAMMKMMKDNPGMMGNMMGNMLETCKTDSVMMSGMCKTLMENKPMMDMMRQKMGVRDMNMMKGMHK